MNPLPIVTIGRESVIEGAVEVPSVGATKVHKVHFGDDIAVFVFGRVVSVGNFFAVDQLREHRFRFADDFGFLSWTIGQTFVPLASVFPTRAR